MAFRLAVWFMEVYGDYTFKAPEFVMPRNEPVPDYESIIKDLEEQLAKADKAEPISTATDGSSSKDRADKSTEVTESIELTEAETRIIIDDQLRKYGWEVDTNSLRYSKGTRPQKGRNLAIAEFPTDSIVTKGGFADYALFVGLKLVAIVEAKKASIDISSVIDNQCKDYARTIKFRSFSQLTEGSI